jgi:hypothetical protein
MSQQDKTTLQSNINSQLADNTTGDISAADVRNNLINITDSLVFNNGNQSITGSLIATGGITGSLQGTSTTASYVDGVNVDGYVNNAYTANVALNANAATVATQVSSIPVISSWVRIGLLPTAGEYENQNLGYDPDGNLIFNAGTNQLFAPNISSSVSITGSSILATNGFTGSLRGTAATASYISPTFISSSAAASGFGSGGGSSFPYTGSAGISGSLVLDGTLRQGQSTQTSGNYSRAYGNSSIASGNYSHAEGNTAQAGGQYSHAEGQFTVANGDASHAEGVGTITNGIFSHAEGLGTITQGMGQHAQGKYNITSSTVGAFILGNGSDDDNRSNLIFAAENTVQITGSLDVTGYISSSLFAGTSLLSEATYGAGDPLNTTGGEIQFRGSSNINGLNNYSSAFMWNPFSLGVTIGDPNTSGGNGSYFLATGYDSIANGNYSVSHGSSSYANGEGSFTHGKTVTAAGNYSHAEGLGTIASGSYQHVEGRFNTQGDSTSLLIIGNGTADGSRKDAFKVRMSGSIILPTTQSTAPSWTGTDGEMVFATVTGNHRFYVWMAGAWRSGSLA